MSYTLGKQTHVLLDIWVAYTVKLLRDHPGSWTRYAHYTPHYHVYKKVNGKKVEILNYARFRKAIELYFDRAKSAIIKGDAIDMYGGVGKICARRVERDFRKKKQLMIDWHNTRKQPLVWNEAKQKLSYKNVIYFMDDDWCRIGWHKNGYNQNESNYEFKPAAANSARTSGFTLEFDRAMKADPLLKYTYLYIPKIP